MPVSQLSRGRFAPVVAFLLLLCCGSSGLWLFWQQRGADIWVRHSLAVQDQLGRVQVLTARAEINRRGYLLTGNPQNVEAYRKARRAVAPEMTELVHMTTDNPAQQRRISELESDV